MLKPFRKLNGTFSEVKMDKVPMCRLVSGDLLRTLMKRTGTGARITVRDLAAAVQVPNGTIGALTTGAQRFLPEDKGKRIASTIGVDYLILFVPCERAGRTLVDIREAVSA
ncbi:hypothetical protein OG530_19125 [Streptomyces decoyicus]|uniref:hypothetical protein n=1 Tax=Streptomyces decoyicus TaxID=249567 RepID=UPI002E1817FE